ncbi:thermonuclease family protein [Agrobacterium sp. SUL3]|uniref:thermonuclease family protein n=1 Tax=Agrobacterium sp. SUL3 TaxID=1701910 RepID=UPI0012E2A7CC
MPQYCEASGWIAKTTTMLKSRGMTLVDNAKKSRPQNPNHQRLIASYGFVVFTAIMGTTSPGEAAEHIKLTGAIGICAKAARTTCVIDGDTLWLRGEKIRVADIDTPEISEPKCTAELQRGNRATARLVALLNEGPFELHGWPGRNVDRYGRKLRVLVRDGRSLGDVLVSEGLARTWSGRREPWCDR